MPIADAPYAFDLAKVESADDWKALLARLGRGILPQALVPLRQIFDLARKQDCRTVLIEHRYTDIDFRSEFIAYWAGRHEERHPYARRLHFFASRLNDADVHRIDPSSCGYLGYTILRPAGLGPVGRSVVAVPWQDLGEARAATVKESVSVFGADLSLTGVPFCQQDGEMLRCAHAASWTAHYVNAKRGIAPRRSTAQIAGLAPTQVSPHRTLPSSGLRVEQMAHLFERLGTPALLYDCKDLPEVPGVANGRERLEAVMCKYLTSGFPVVVLTESDHAFTLVGWRWANGKEGKGPVEFLACDDQVGPLGRIRVPDGVGDEFPWTGLMIPLPPKVYLSGEGAELAAYNTLATDVDVAREKRREPSPEAQRIVSGLEDRTVGVRSYLMEGRAFKKGLAEIRGDSDAVRLLRLIPLPNWVWIVEFQDQAARRAGKPCVIAQTILDSTTHDALPTQNATALQGGVFATEPESVVAKQDVEPRWFVRASEPGLWRSVESQLATSHAVV